jgi:hypothetical protein
VSAELKEQEALEQVRQESVSILDRVKALVVKDQATYNLATDLYKAALAVEKAADEAHNPVVEHWHQLHSAACAAKKADKDLATQAKVLAKSKAAVWQDEQERIRLEAERKRLAAIEEEERIRLAAEAEALGATKEQVTEILETPLPIPEPEPYIAPSYIAPTLAPTFKKASGFAPRWNYKGVVTDISALIKAASINPYLAMYLEPNQSAINDAASHQKDAFSLPGCVLDKKRV